MTRWCASFLYAWINLLQRLVPSSLVTRFYALVEERQGGHAGRSFGSGLSDIL